MCFSFNPCYGVYVSVLFSSNVIIITFSGGQVSRYSALREKIKGENIVHLVKILVAFPLMKLFALFAFLLHGYWQRQNYVPVLHDSSINNEMILQCLERLKKLEKDFTETSRIPLKIPEANEKLLTESLERIKSLELDLDKTKSVRTLLDLDLLLLPSLTVFFFFFLSYKIIYI